MSQRLRIQAAVVETLRATTFPVVVYASDGTPSTTVVEDTTETLVETPILPILCNEVSSIFEEDLLYKRGVKDKKNSWTFEVRLRFNREVLLEDFEEAWIARPYTLPAEGDLPPVTLRLQTAEIEHPVQQGGTNGTIAKYTFEAEQGRG
jgi:hypothetical protein